MIVRHKTSRLFLLLFALLSVASANPQPLDAAAVREPDPLPIKPQPVTLEAKIRDVVELPDGVGVERKVPSSASSSSTSKSSKDGSEKSSDVTNEVKSASSESSSSSIASTSSTPYKLITDTKSSLNDLNPITSTTNSLISSTHSMMLSFLMILCSEIGDKTFLIAALMAMKHPRLLVFSAAFSSLVVMTVLSAFLGHAVPTLIPKWLTNWIAAGLFLVFGVRMLLEGLKMDKGTAGVKEEMKEVEQELVEKEAEARGRTGSMASMMEEGRGTRFDKNRPRRSTASPTMSDSDDDDYPDSHGHSSGGGNFMKSLNDGFQNLAGLLLSPAWVQTFVMTFLGEWGDRSQIATIAMAAGQDYWFVILGSISGHAVCTAGAVIGGRLLAEKISVRNVTLGGSIAFLVFSVIYLLEAIYA